MDLQTNTKSLEILKGNYKEGFWKDWQEITKRKDILKGNMHTYAFYPWGSSQNQFKIGYI